ncbi:MAG: endopeptidase La [Paraperlucidibaca sp.]|jgi:ATP-dependent Lon protease|uniref:endopeptidase La n=1 Tax=Paraperlucidibaca sp. TaxID=2708021 RepID=UPI001B778AE5|nr:endopeptidase La [Paraperlucidibaca sp.]MBQ0722157.1 endopeptidase La [Paraperlucidibaca sp.]MBQ0842645.1 endopeptidase La [Paraperlucidibaca sp.]|tara:strand:- start:2426 stop:4822 length:2397 start_codon:yes stop_codon:yes gene_type:complete
MAAKKLHLPLLPLRDVVIYPHMVIPLFVGRERSIAALDQAMATDKHIFLVSQRDAGEDDPDQDGLYSIGTIANILQLLKLPDGTIKVLVEGQRRGQLLSLSENEDAYIAQVAEVQKDELTKQDSEILVRTLLNQFDQYVKLSKKVANEVLTSVAGIDDPSRLADTIAAHLTLRLEEKQAILDILPVQQRVEHLMAQMESEIDILKVEKRIRGRVKKQMEKSQREYYLNEQIKAIQKELGDLGESEDELSEVEQRIIKAGLPAEARKKVDGELRKLRQMSPMSAEATVVRSYIDWMLGVPWKKRNRVRIDLKEARDILDADHFGLEEVKDRILEYLAVQSRVKQLNGAVLCLVGPPGVGKTSLGQSIAKATNRQFVRMALGGVRDEAEIRGHRRTYIGSMPGKLIQKISKVGVRNPLFLLDEIDKMASDMRGDPSSALLEVLDPEQNKAFNDHYLEVDYDLSEVMFLCTANSMDIPAPLLDRMEIIRLPGYTEDEKVAIARQYLVPKQLIASGLKDSELVIEESACRDIVRYYTREAGVRALDREIAKLCRKVVKSLVMGTHSGKLTLGAEQLEDYLGVHKFNYGKAEAENQVGQVTGLAWTQVGGELLTIEAIAVPGKGGQLMTGSLGDVMQESIRAASTVVRSRSRVLGISAELFEKRDIHIHMPEGATPKDGPSAGIGMCTALASVLTGIPVRADVAMTGEITLRGQVLPIGGLKEKLLAAHRGGVRTVIIPEENARDLKEIPDNVKAALEIITVKWIDEVLAIALTQPPIPLTEEAYAAGLAQVEKRELPAASRH